MRPDPREIARFLAEDVGSGDITSALIGADRTAVAAVWTREALVLCGRDWFDAVFHHLNADVRINWQAYDGETCAAGARLCTLEGPARALLTGERVALNLLQTLSATASLARQYAEAVRGTGVVVLDTRKTLPGLRLAQKYAVRCGGCANHRIGLYDALLIKENHILASGSLTAAVQEARVLFPSMPVEVEVETLAQLREALECGVERALLDNFPLEDLRVAVQVTRGRAALEASGNVTLATVRTVAETGVDYISVGALTKDVRAVDLSMRITLD